MHIVMKLKLLLALMLTFSLIACRVVAATEEAALKAVDAAASSTEDIVPLEPLGLVNPPELVLALELLSGLLEQRGKIDESINEQSYRWMMDRFLVGSLEQGFFNVIEDYYILIRDLPIYSPSGRLLQSLLYDGVDNVRYSQRDEDWTKLFERMELWQQRYPDSEIAPIVYAMLLEQRAWIYRGSGPASNIPRARMAKFKEYIGKADAMLEHNKALALKNPQWYAVKVNLLRYQGKASPAQLAPIANSALKLFPDYDRLHFNLVLTQLPNWGGNAKRIDEMIALILSHHPDEQDKLVIYTRLYWIARSNYYGGDFFNETLADWHKMRQGFQLITAEYPDDWNLNHFAATACLADDLNTMFGLLPRIKRYYRAAWFGSDAFHQRCVELSKV